MKTFDFHRILFVLFSLFSLAQVGATPIHLVNKDGILIGAKNVDVGGTLYDVKFEEGTCNAIFNGCDKSKFAFRTPAGAYAAAQALLAQVFVDGRAGRFDSQPDLTFGCENLFSLCSPIIPYDSWPWYHYGTDFGGYFPNNDIGPNNLKNIGSIAGPSTFDTTWWYYNFAVFEIATGIPAEVPEPDSLAMFGMGICGLMLSRRRAKKLRNSI